MQSSSLGVATTSSDVGAGCAALEAMEAEDSAPGSMSSADEELLDELESSTAGLALKGGLALEAALACGSHSPGGPLGLGLGGGGGWRGVGEPDSPFGAAAAAGLAPAMGALCTACIRFRTSARMVESDLTLFLNQAALETLGWSGRRPDKYTWYAVSKTGSRRTADAWAGSFPCPLPLPALGWPFPLPLEGWKPSLAPFPFPFPGPFPALSSMAARS